MPHIFVSSVTCLIFLCLQSHASYFCVFSHMHHIFVSSVTCLIFLCLQSHASYFCVFSHMPHIFGPYKYRYRVYQQTLLKRNTKFVTVQIREAYFFLAEDLPLGLWYNCTWFQNTNLLYTCCLFLLCHSHIILPFKHNAANIRLKMAVNRF